MNKTLTLEYHPIVDIGVNNSLVGNTDATDALRTTFNGQSVWAPFNLLDNHSGYKTEATVNFIPTETNTISLHSVQKFNGISINITGNITIRPVDETHWNIRFTYDWRNFSKEELKEIFDVFKTDYEGFKFKFNDYVLHDVKACQAGALYANEEVIIWDTNTPLEFFYEESGQSKGGYHYIQELKLTLS